MLNLKIYLDISVNIITFVVGKTVKPEDGPRQKHNLLIFNKMNGKKFS
jgi:hypothetical protein